MAAEAAADCHVPARFNPPVHPLAPTQAAALLRRELRAQIDPADVCRMVRHGNLAGEAQAGGRVVVDGDALRELVAVTREAGTRPGAPGEPPGAHAVIVLNS